MYIGIKPKESVGLTMRLGRFLSFYIYFTEKTISILLYFFFVSCIIFEVFFLLNKRLIQIMVYFSDLIWSRYTHKKTQNTKKGKLLRQISDQSFNMKKVNFMTCGSLLQINMTDDLICIHMSFLSIGDMSNFEKIKTIKNIVEW